MLAIRQITSGTIAQVRLLVATFRSAAGRGQRPQPGVLGLGVGVPDLAHDECSSLVSS